MSEPAGVPEDGDDDPATEDGDDRPEGDQPPETGDESTDRSGMRPEDERYFDALESRLDDALALAERAREGSRDPSESVEIPVAADMADRVEKVLGIDGVADRVRDLEGEMSREEAALELAADFAEGRVGDYETKAGKVEGAVRTAVALLTEGVVAAPIEGIDRVELVENDDGSECIAIYYAGPIRSAGGTAQALSVLVADYARTLVGVDEYKPRDAEVGRYAEELTLYDEETGLQYAPKDEETEFIAEHVPILLDGEATGDEEVDSYRDLDRVDTNNPRGGMCLVLGEGIAQKAPKIQRYTRDIDEVDWPWLEDLIEGSVGGADDGDESDREASDEGEEVTDVGATDENGNESEATDHDGAVDGPPRPDSSKKFLRDLIAGRPVFSHPSETGGFRLRYGRARNHGFATAGVHPATMHLVDDFLATGTQIKTERPGKAAGVVPVDSIEGPTVRLANGDVRRIDDPEEAREIRNGVEAVLDLGEYLVNYGEFVENNHDLVPASYAVEWWVQEFDDAGGDVTALRDDPHVDLDDPEEQRAIEWAREYDAPLHPEYTYLWHDVGVDEFEALADAVADGTVESDELVLEHDDPTRETLEALLVEHRQRDDEIRVPEWRALALSLGVSTDLERTWSDLPAAAREWDGGENAVKAVNAVAPFAVRERAPTRVGNRMGRPEKSEERELSPAVHCLFPLGEAGGDQRSVAEAAAHSEGMSDAVGEVEVEVGRRECVDCGERTWRTTCEDCGGHTDPHYTCPECGQELVPDDAGRVHCGNCDVDGTSVEPRAVDVGAEYREALQRVGERENAFDVLKGVKGLSSEHKTPEPIEKGVLRAKHGVSAFKDGTVRYDMTDLPVTAVRPAELDVTAEQFRELGYETDVHGDRLEHDDQLVHLKVQDVVLSAGAAEHMLSTADFVDDLLTSYYGLPPFYEVDDREDLVGELVFGMAPHTSAAVVGRVVGFTSASVGYAHPYFHAAKRRNCFHPDTTVWYEDEDGDWRHESIETLVEDRLEDPREDDFGTLVQDLEGEIRVPSHDTDGTQRVRGVEAVSKHPSPAHLVRVTTRSGRTITVTPDHEMHVYDEETDQLVGAEARTLDEDDSLATPKHLDAIEREEETLRFDLLDEFLETEAVDDDRLMIEGLDKERLYGLFERAFEPDWDGEFYPLTSTAEHFGLSKKTMSNYLNRESLPASILKACFESRSELLDFVPDDVSLGIKRDVPEIDRFVELNDRVATLLGYYAAEGFAREQETSKGTLHQTTVCGTESEAREFFMAVLREEFGVEPYEENHAKITVSGRLLRAFFDTVLDAGILAHTKRVPQCIFDADDDVVAAYLSGYFSGDGSVDNDAIHIKSTTVSSELKSDIQALLTKLGISARVKRVDPVPLANQFPEFYDADDESMSAERWVIQISSKDAVRFQSEVGLHLSRKDDRLRDQVESKYSSARRVFDGGTDDFLVDPIEDIEFVESGVEYVYCLTVAETHSLIANDLSQKQCDGDEDCVMLLMDGLLNFSKEYLPDQRGGSVAADSRLVAVSPDGDVRFLTVEEFWTELDADVQRDGKFRKKSCRSAGWQTFVFDDDHGGAIEPIEKAIRYPASDDETLVRVETQFGRTIDITRDHSLFRYDDGIEEVAGEDLEEGDLVVAPRQLDVETEETTIDVAASVEEPYVFIDDRVEDLLRTVWEATDRGSDAHDEFMRGLSYRLAKNKISLQRLENILDAGGFEGVPEDVTIGLAGSERGIDRTVEVDEEFAWLLGLFVAEGTLSSPNPALHNSDEEIVDRAVEVATEALGSEPNTRWTNRSYEVLFPGVFEEVLYDLGFADVDSYDSSEKVVPPCIRRAPREVVLSFLRGFVAGDGSDESDDNVTTVAFHSTSEDVKDGIVFLLHRLGLVANVSRQTERAGNRQPIYEVTVSGGADDNPLHRILDGEAPYRPKSLVVSIPDALMDLREMDVDGVKQFVPKYLRRRENVSLEKLGEIVEEFRARELSDPAREKLSELEVLVDGDLSYLRVKDVEPVDYDGHLYDLQVGGEPIFTANWLYAHNSMDAPLVMSSRIDPTEIDDEAHNVDVVSQYPREFYEATREMAAPGEVDVTIAEETLGTDEQYAGFEHTHDTGDVAMGPDLSAYKTLDSMMDKMEAQLELARKLRAVEEADVAERVIEYHFLPDLLGNLRAFASQEVRCLDCGEKYRRAPLTGDCRECGGDVTLTVHRGSVNKYMDVARRIAEEYGTEEYTRQRLEVLDRSLESIFEDDTNKQSGIADFM